MLASCGNFSDASEFSVWVASIRDHLGFYEGALENCKPEICRALWGVGNPDVSGIGVISALVISVVLSFSLGCAVWAIDKFEVSGPQWLRQAQGPALQGMSTFFNCAVFFAIAIEFAITVVLSRLSIPAQDYGIFEASVVHATSIVCLVPLLYPLALMDVWILPPRDDGAEVPESETQTASAGMRRRKGYALSLFSVVLLFAAYPFFSQWLKSEAIYHPNIISKDGAPQTTDNLSQTEYDALLSLCFRDSKPLSDDEYRTLEALGAIAVVMVIVVYLLEVSKALYWFWDGARRDGLYSFVTAIERTKSWAQKRWTRVKPSWLLPPVLEAVLLTFPLIVASLLLWGIYRIRKAQMRLALETENRYSDDEWTFGQVVAVVIFIQVPSDMANSWWHSGRSR